MPKLILIVDDQDLIIRVLQASLRATGAHITSAKPGTEAIRKLASPPLPNAIILDYSMPDQDGVETLRQIRALPGGKDIPVIMLTARDQTLIREAARDLSVLAFMTKPFSPASLLQTVKEALQKSGESSGAAAEAE
jgi:CheY-like chemotaxis protein